MQASVLGPASVDGVCGRSHTRGNCMIALRLTRGYRKSGDDREWRRELASNLRPASRHPRRILTSKMTPLSAVWLCPWIALRTCLDSVGVNSAYTTAWRRWYKRREWTGRKLCTVRHEQKSTAEFAIKPNCSNYLHVHTRKPKFVTLHMATHARLTSYCCGERLRCHWSKFNLARHVMSLHDSTRSTCRASRDESSAVSRV